MFRPERETFCLVLSDSAICLGGASGVDLELQAHLCRLHFEPDRFDEVELARRVALAIEAATMTVQPVLLLTEEVPCCRVKKACRAGRRSEWKNGAGQTGLNPELAPCSRLD